MKEKEIIKDSLDRTFKKQDLEESLFAEEQISKSPLPIFSDFQEDVTSHFPSPEESSLLENIKEIEQEMKNPLFHQVLLIYSAEAVYFIFNVHSLNVEKMAKIIQIGFVDLWRTNFSLIEFENFVPSPLKKHFLQVENYLISYLVWKGPESVYKWYKKYELMASNRSLYSSPQINQMPIQIKTSNTLYHNLFFIFE